MTRPRELPALPAFRTARPPAGFEDAVRAAGRRRWRQLAGGAGGALAALALLLAAPGGAGPAGLRPAPPAGPGRTPPAAVPVDGATAPATAATTAATPAATRGPAIAPHAPASPAVVVPRRSAGPRLDRGNDTAQDGGVPWTRAQSKADLTQLATCVDDGHPGAPSDGARHGDWCVWADAFATGTGATFTIRACAVSPAAQALTFADGHEVDYAVDGEWSSATGRTFPAEPGQPVDPAYGTCTSWKAHWDGTDDDGGRVGAGTYTLHGIVRAQSGALADLVTFTLSS